LIHASQNPKFVDPVAVLFCVLQQVFHIPVPGSAGEAERGGDTAGTEKKS